MHFIHLPSRSPKVSQEVLIVTSASLTLSFFHEPSLPAVLLPVQDGWGCTHFSGDSCIRNVDIFSTLFFFFFFLASLIVSFLASARKNPHPCLGPWPQHQHTHLPFGASLDLSFPRNTEQEKSPERRNPAFPERRFLFIYFSDCLAACSCRGFASSLFLFSSFSFMSVSPPGSCGQFTWFSSTSCICSAALLPLPPWGPDCSRPRALEQFPSSFLSPLDAQPVVGQMAAPAVLWVPGASD